MGRQSEGTRSMEKIQGLLSTAGTESAWHIIERDDSQ